MHKHRQIVTLILVAAIPGLCFAGSVKKKDKAVKSEAEIARGVLTVLWRQPDDIASRDLFYGPGGKKDEPQGPFTFIREDLDGSNAKFTVRDREGVKWKVKLGAEAEPETVASRLVWSVGYFASEDYFLNRLQVQDMPVHLRRRQAGRFIEPDGSMRNVRLKREPDNEKKIGIWSWRSAPFSGTRELDGLRVMMALINNWDLKNENNAIYDQRKRSDSQHDERVYMVSDLGASFGTAWLDRTHEKSKGNLEWYSRTKFITKTTTEYVDFEDPRRPALIFLANPHEYFGRLRLRWIGRHIPREDAKWMGGILAQLSHKQILDAFRAGGYSPQSVEGFSAVVESRIAALNKL